VRLHALSVCLQGFWRNWHASYNRWLVRYMYVPLGGAATRALSVWLIFTFVALWCACVSACPARHAQPGLCACPTVPRARAI
jgi:MBOAT, membrane-bound O-acyltransferase family